MMRGMDHGNSASTIYSKNALAMLASGDIASCCRMSNMSIAIDVSPTSTYMARNAIAHESSNASVIVRQDLTEYRFDAMMNTQAINARAMGDVAPINTVDMAAVATTSQKYRLDG